MAKIGILCFIDPLNTGGVFQYIMSLIDGLKKVSKHEYILFYNDPKFKNFCSNTKYFRLVPIQENETIFTKIIRKMSLSFGFKSPLLGKYGAIKDHKIDLLINPLSSSICFHIGYPYIVVIYDLMHRYYTKFPEYSLMRRAMRELEYKKATKYSVLTVVDSKQSEEDLIRFYNIKRNKIRIIPYCPPWYIYKYRNLDEFTIKNVINKYNLPEKFIFYPAQFWLHKNHKLLIESLYILREQFNVIIPIVFVGSQKKDSKNTLTDIKKVIKQLRLEKQVFILGYLSEKEIVALYKTSIALVYPSLIGPTNIPILEAMVLGTPVLCSNLFSMPDQTGDAGLLFDPFNVNDMVEKIHRIWVDENLRQELIQKGYKKVKNMTLENFAMQWEKIIEEALQFNK